MKASPWPLIQAHYGTYVDASTGKRRWQDHVTFAGPPAVVALVCLLTSVKLPESASVGLLTVAGLLSAFFFGVMLQVTERAMLWADEHPSPGPETSSQAIFLEEIAANAGYAALVSIAAAVLFVVVVVTKDTALIVATALGLAVATHLMLVLLMVIRRVFALTQGRLATARTSGSVTHMTKRRNSG